MTFKPAYADRLVQGPVGEYGAIYTEIDANTQHSRFASHSTHEWFGPFEAELLKPIHLTDNYGRFDAGREVHMRPGRVFVTRLTSVGGGKLPVDFDDVKVMYYVLDRNGLRQEVPAERAAEFLRMARDENNQLIPVREDDTYKRAAERRSRMMSY